MRVMIGQFAASTEWDRNLATCRALVAEAAAGGADLLVLPEGVLARFTDDFARIRTAAQPLDGPFVQGLLDATGGTGVTLVAGVHERAPDGLAYNTLVVAHQGRLVAHYRKLHLFDAFESRESDNVRPGTEPPVTFPCAGRTVGLMTCYDVRFPETARLLVDQGADVLVLPAAWVRGPLKERHWDVMVTARALENTCYVVAAGECGPRNIGASMVVDPLGVVIARAGADPDVLWARVSPERLDQARAALPVLANRRFRVDPTARPLDQEPARSAAPASPSARRSP